MDNLTHTLAALVLAKTRLGRTSPMARAALVVSANAPDLDGIVGFWGGREAYLHHHRGLSHSVFGLAILAVLLWLLFRWVETWWPLEGLAGRARSRGGLLAAICVGLATHPLLDSLNGYGVRPWLPFDGTHYYGDLVFIVDPWLWCILGGAAALMGPRSRAGNWAWLSLAIAASGVVYLSGRAPSALSWLWPVAVAAIAAARIVGIGSRRPRAVLLAAAVAFAGYLGIQEAAGRLAQSRALEDLAAQLPAGERILGSSRAPQPGGPRDWVVTVDTNHFVYQRFVTLGGGTIRQYRIANNLDLPEVAAAAKTPTGAVWREFARHPVAVLGERDGSRCVYLLDARYSIEAAPHWSALVVPLDSSGNPSSTSER
jgi:inner membrane protein